MAIITSYAWVCTMNCYFFGREIERPLGDALYTYSYVHVKPLYVTVDRRAALQGVKR